MLLAWDLAPLGAHNLFIVEEAPTRQAVGEDGRRMDPQSGYLCIYLTASRRNLRSLVSSCHTSLFPPHVKSQQSWCPASLDTQRPDSPHSGYVESSLQGRLGCATVPCAEQVGKCSLAM